MHSYTVYGLGLHSVFPLPELISKVVRPDVEISLGSLNERPGNVDFDDPAIYYHCWTTAEGTHLHWRDVATFLIRDGRAIIIDPVPNVEEKRLRLILLGAVLSILLHQRGYLVFHSSALAIGGNGVMFIGNKGWGKSTMAAVLHSRGHKFLSDDVVAIDDRTKNTFSVLPAFPQVKLWSDAISAMGNDPDKFPTVSTLFDKRDCRFEEGFSQSNVPLKCIYVLGVSENVKPEIRPLKMQEALVYLIAHTYHARWGSQMFTKDSTTHFTRCSQIIKNIPVYHLIRPRSLELLPSIAQMVEEHIFDNAID